MGESALSFAENHGGRAATSIRLPYDASHGPIASRLEEGDGPVGGARERVGQPNPIDAFKPTHQLEEKVRCSPSECVPAVTVRAHRVHPTRLAMNHRRAVVFDNRG